jgi:glycosyltransferase involved in cell wall biosynthesis
LAGGRAIADLEAAVVAQAPEGVGAAEKGVLLTIAYLHRTRSKDGQNVHIESMVTALRGLGHRIIMIEPAATSAAGFGDGGGLIARMKRVLPLALYEILESAYQLVELPRLLAACLTARPHAIYQRANLHMLSGILAARLLRIPLIVEVNAPLTDERRKEPGLGLPRLARWTERCLWRSADRVLPVTDVLGGIVIAAGVESRRVRVIPNGVDRAAFGGVIDADTAKGQLGLQGRLVIGFVGFVRDWHRGDRILRFLAQPDTPPNAHFLLVGDGPARAGLTELAHALGVDHRLTITGVMPRSSVPSAVAAFDVAVLPDVVDYACPLKLIEYMAMGRAIVAPDKANVREFVSSERSALLVDPDDPAALGRALLRLAADPGLRRRLGAAAEAAVQAQGLTWSDNARQVQDIVLELGSPPGTIS